MLPASLVITYIHSIAKLLHLEASLGLLNLQILPAQGNLSKSAGKTRLIYTSKWHHLNVTCIPRTIKTENKIKVGSETNNNILSASLLAFKLCGSKLQSSYGILFCASSSAHREIKETAMISLSNMVHISLFKWNSFTHLCVNNMIIVRCFLTKKKKKK